MNEPRKRRARLASRHGFDSESDEAAAEIESKMASRLDCFGWCARVVSESINIAGKDGGGGRVYEGVEVAIADEGIGGSELDSGGEFSNVEVWRELSE